MPMCGDWQESRFSFSIKKILIELLRNKIVSPQVVLSVISKHPSVKNVTVRILILNRILTIKYLTTPLSTYSTVFIFEVLKLVR